MLRRAVFQRARPGSRGVPPAATAAATAGRAAKGGIQGWGFESSPEAAVPQRLRAAHAAAHGKVTQALAAPLPELPIDGSNPQLLIGFTHYNYRQRLQYRRALAEACGAALTEDTEGKLLLKHAQGGANAASSSKATAATATATAAKLPPPVVLTPDDVRLSVAWQDPYLRRRHGFADANVERVGGVALQLPKEASAAHALLDVEEPVMHRAVRLLTRRINEHRDETLMGLYVTRASATPALTARPSPPVASDVVTRAAAEIQAEATAHVVLLLYTDAQREAVEYHYARAFHSHRVVPKFVNVDRVKTWPSAIWHAVRNAPATGAATETPSDATATATATAAGGGGEAPLDAHTDGARLQLLKEAVASLGHMGEVRFPLVFVHGVRVGSGSAIRYFKGSRFQLDRLLHAPWQLDLRPPGRLLPPGMGPSRGPG